MNNQFIQLQILKMITAYFKQRIVASHSNIDNDNAIKKKRQDSEEE